jgi:hypothetical protein
MKFLFKAAFWLTVVLILLPTGGSKENAKSTAADQQISAGEAVSAASAAMSDMRQFCARQPGACAVGAQAAATLGHKAQAGAKMLYEFLSEKLGPQETGSVGSNNLSGKAAASAARPSQHQLTPTDLAPTWRAPQRKDVDKSPA